jgi:hypothetical protein
MSTNTSKASKTSKASSGAEVGTADTTVRSGLRTGEQVVAVQFGAWGPQEVSVRAYSNGGRGGAPYVVVGVGICLTYAYDQAAVDSHLTAWQDAEQVNRTCACPSSPPPPPPAATRGRT